MSTPIGVCKPIVYNNRCVQHANYVQLVLFTIGQIAHAHSCVQHAMSVHQQVCTTAELCTQQVYNRRIVYKYANRYEQTGEFRTAADVKIRLIVYIENNRYE